jgi:hypothetical protein
MEQVEQVEQVKKDKEVKTSPIPRSIQLFAVLSLTEQEEAVIFLLLNDPLLSSKTFHLRGYFDSSVN